MQKLLEVIKHVRERIKHHGRKLHQNEMLTRYALVDPILRALNWDTEDPEQVMPEFQTEVGRPDYILRYNDLRVGVEAKRLGAAEKEFERAYKKALPLWQTHSIRYYAITDGDRWILWDISKPRKAQPPIFDLRLSCDNLGTVARQLLALWRPAMPEVETAPESVVEPISMPKERRARPPEGLPLTELLERMQPNQEPPAQIHFPDEDSKPLERWKDLLIEVAKWALPKLQAQEKLPLGKLIQQDSQKMRAPRAIGDDWQVETWFSARDCVRNAIRILKEAGESPDKVSVTGWQGRISKGGKRVH